MPRRARDRNRAGREPGVQAGAGGPCAIGARSGVEEIRDRPVTQPLHGDKAGSEQRVRTPSHGEAAESPHTAVAVWILIAPRRLTVDCGSVLARVQLAKRGMTLHGIARALQPADRAQFAPDAWRGGEIDERRRDVGVDELEVRSLEVG